jgi:hypothetical protein
MQRIARSRNDNNFAILCTFNHAEAEAEAEGFGIVNKKTWIIS